MSKIIDINKILNDWAYRVDGGMPDPKKLSHQILLEKTLIECGWNVAERYELIKSLQEANKPNKDGYVHKGRGRYVKAADADKENATQFIKTDDGKYVPDKEQSSDNQQGDGKEKGSDVKGLTRGGEKGQEEPNSKIEKKKRQEARIEADKKDYTEREEKRKKSKDPRKTTHTQKHIDDLNNQKEELQNQIKNESNSEKKTILEEDLAHIEKRIKKLSGILTKQLKEEKVVRDKMENPSSIGNKLNDKERGVRNNIDISEINSDEDGNPRSPKERQIKLQEKLEKRRNEIYLGKDLPAGTAGSTTGEMGGGMAAEDITNDMEVDKDGNVTLKWDGEEVSEEEYEERWIAKEKEKIDEAKGLRKKICGSKKKEACDELVNEWLKVAYRTGRNEVHQLITNPDYEARIPQPKGMPTGHVMDYNNQALVQNELEQRLKEAEEAGDTNAIKHYKRQLEKLEGLKETDTGVLYMDKDGRLRFKHTSNKKSEKDPHYNKSIQSKKASMQESAKRKLDECEFIESGEEKKKCQEETKAAIKTIEETSDKGSKTVYDGDRVVGSDVRNMDEDARKSLKEGAGILGKLPGRSATKGEPYADKVRKRSGDYKKLHDECKELHGEQPWTDEQIMEAQIQLMEKGDRVTRPNSDVEKIKQAGEGEVVDLGDGKYGKLIDGVPRVCDKDGNPDFSVISAKLLYKTSEMISTMRGKAVAKTKPKGWPKDRPWPMKKDENGNYNDEDLIRLGQEYDPELTLEEMKWIMTSRGADRIAESNDKRKVANDGAHQDVVSDIQNQDAQLDGFEENENGHVVDENGNNGPATQLYVDSFMEDMHWNRYIDGDHDGVGDMSINGQNVQPKHFRECLAKLSGYSPDKDNNKKDLDDPEVRKELKQHLKNKIRISARKADNAGDTDALTAESRDAHISFDSDTVDAVADTRQGREEGATRPVSVGEERFRSKGVGVNSVVGGLGLDMQECILEKMNSEGSNAVGAAE